MQAGLLAAVAVLLALPLAAPSAAVPAVAAVTSPAEAWPHAITGKNGTVTVYQPQVVDWPGRTAIDARMAVSIQPNGAAAPILGTIEITGATTTDLAARTVSVTDLKLKSSHFPSLDTARATGLDERIQTALAAMPAKIVPLDSVLLSLQQVADVQEVPVSNTPPVIDYSAGPASLIVFDGEPVMAPVPGSKLTRAVNTNWDVFFSAADQTWYLLNNESWFAAPAYNGPWTPKATLPAAITALAASPELPELHGHIPGRPVASGAVPAFFVSTVPAELIVTAGPADWRPVPGTSLQVASNTTSTVVRDAGGKVYFLASGRWFAAPGFDGPWSFAGDKLPPDFAMIPADGKLAPVLAAVPGTQQAQEAVIQAQIPVQATLSRQTATLKVLYAGPPNFLPIPGSTVAYATNTATPVFRVAAVFYACWKGAWFMAASPIGPWKLAPAVPAAIYAIPPTHPFYPVTYVRVYAATPVTVTYGYTAGYTLGFISAGVLVYGTGYYYPPVVVPGPIPVYFPYPYSYAGAAYYNPYSAAWARGGAYYNSATGGWAHGGAVYGPYGGAGAWSAYNPATGRYSQGSASWGSYGGAAHASFYNPSTGISGSTTQDSNGYSRWGSSVVSGPNKTVNTQSARNANGAVGGFSSSTGAAGAGVHGARGNNAAVGRGANGDVYAGADGNVYRKDGNGWSKYNSGSWNPVKPPTSSGSAAHSSGQTDFHQLDSDQQARNLGASRQRQFGQGGYSQGGYSRGGLGGSRGGGGGNQRFLRR